VPKWTPDSLLAGVKLEYGDHTQSFTLMIAFNVEHVLYAELYRLVRVLKTRKSKEMVA
jgi:hypothetical protein